MSALGRSRHSPDLAVASGGGRARRVARRRPRPPKFPPSPSRQRAEKKTFTDSEIIEGFFKTAFGAEYHLAGRVDRIRKYDAPVRVFADGNRADRKAQLAKVVADIAARVQHLDIAMAESSDDANVAGASWCATAISIAPSRPSTAASGRARSSTSLDPQCLSGFRKNEKFEIEHSDVILTVDNGDFVFLDCAYEELLQSLGPINDTSDACPGPCSTTMCRWAISTSTISTS